MKYIIHPYQEIDICNINFEDDQSRFRWYLKLQWKYRLFESKVHHRFIVIFNIQVWYTYESYWSYLILSNDITDKKINQSWKKKIEWKVLRFLRSIESHWWISERILLKTNISIWINSIYHRGNTNIQFVSLNLISNIMWNSNSNWHLQERIGDYKIRIWFV